MYQKDQVRLFPGVVVEKTPTSGNSAQGTRKGRDMTVLQGNTTGGVSSNRWGKAMIGLAAVVVGLAAAYGISQQIDSSGSVTVPVTQGADFRTNVMQKRALEGYVGATLSPANKVADIQRHLEDKRALEGVTGSTPTVKSDMAARAEAGRALLEELNEAAILQARITAGAAYGNALEAANEAGSTGSEQAKALQEINEAWPTGSEQTTTPQQPSGPR